MKVLVCTRTLYLAALLTGVARGSLVVDQQNSDSLVTYQYLAVNPGFGQSFTPTLSKIDYAAFPIDTSPAPASTYRVDLYSGDGFGGTVIGSSGSQVLPVGTLGNVEFDFPAAITVTPGNKYTLRVVRVSGSNNSLSLLSDTTNPYAGGTQYSYSGAIENGTDSVFSEGTGAVPEPGSIGVIVVGGLAMLRRRRA